MCKTQLSELGHWDKLKKIKKKLDQILKSINNKIKKLKIIKQTIKNITVNYKNQERKQKDKRKINMN